MNKQKVKMQVTAQIELISEHIIKRKIKYKPNYNYDGGSSGNKVKYLLVEIDIYNSLDVAHAIIAFLNK